MIETGDEDRPKGARDADAIKLFAHLFNAHFCPAFNVPPADKWRAVGPASFLNWLSQVGDTIDREVACAAAGVPDATFDFVREVADSPKGADAISMAWFAVCLADRPPPPVPVVSVSAAYVVTFADKTVVVRQGFYHKDMNPDQPALSDADVATVAKSLASQAHAGLVGGPLAAAHAEARGGDAFSTTAAEDPFEVMMGLMIKHLIPMVKPELQRPVLTHVRLAQQLIRPPVPKVVVSTIANEHAKSAAASGESRARGGWDG